MASPWSKLSRRQRQQRAEKLAANPGDRSKIPTEYLKGFAGADEYRAQRAQNARLDTPIVPGSSVTNRQAAQDRESAVRLQYGDQERQLNQTQGDLEYHRDTRIPAWYADYQKQLQQGQAELEAANAAANQQIVALGQGNAALTGQLSNVPAAQADAAQRGATMDPQAAQREGDASRIRGMLNASFGGMLATQGANRVGQAIDTRTRIVPGARVQAQSEQQAKLGRLGEDRSALAKAKADFRQKYSTQQRDDASKSVLEGALFGLKEQSAKADAAKTAADIDIKRGVDPVTGKKIVKPKSASERKTEADLAFFKEHGYYPGTGKPGGNGSDKDRYGNTPKERRNAKNNYATAKATANKYKEGVNGDWKLLRDFIIDKGVKEPMATAAAQEAILGRVGPNTQKSMAEIGVAIVKAKKKTAVGPQGLPTQGSSGQVK